MTSQRYFLNILYIFQKFHLIILFNVLSVKDNSAQIIDTLYYYSPYYPDSLNIYAFVDACLQEGWCEPIAVWFTPDSSRQDTIYNVYSIIGIRFCFTSFTLAYDSISFSIHFGDDFPTESNKVYEQIISVDLNEINQNFLNDGIYMFKDIDVSAIPILKQLNHDINFWVRLNEKVFSVYNTYYCFPPYSYSGHSFGEGLPSGQWGVSDCDWIVQAMVVYDTLTNISKDNTPSYLTNDFILYQNYPNPFNSSETIIKYKITNYAKVDIILYTINGQKVANLISKYQPPGIYKLLFNSEELSSGVYIYVLRVNNIQIASRRMTLIR